MGDEADESGIPATVLDAYKRAESRLARSSPGCNLEWELLAAIGRVESGHARGGDVTSDGTTHNPILGPVLNGNGFANITDTDGGEYDGDTSHDRAVGPMQFIPSTWATWGSDGNDDGERDPDNVYDAALAAGRYLCAGGRDLSSQADLEAAILGYNQSESYLRTVLTWYDFYKEGGADPVPDGSGADPGDRSDGISTPTPPPDRSGNGKPGKDGEDGKGGGKGDGNVDGNVGGDGKDPGGEEPSPPDDGDDTPGEPVPTIADLRVASAQSSTAYTGADFAERPKVRAVTSRGAGVSAKTVTFSIQGQTGAVFDGGGKTASVTTNSSGYATAPVVGAGKLTGEFTIRATAGSGVSPVDFAAEVEASYGLARMGDAALTAAAGGEFGAVEAKVTYRGGPAVKAPVTAAMVTEAGEQNDKGPYFTDADGNPVRKLNLTTADDGTVALPTIHAGDAAGTFLLLLTTNEGVTLTLELTVE
ncbi:lytic transglycosylase domain-containing protein [Streptomyces sp. MAR4 CNX-425]|uniref:lytic transglycosylase domain-containing protein n=1 Tax=Streptomyces sp. MAR4 CNX-425 TaxID=3406343 RepID=UPI003B50062E